MSERLDFWRRRLTGFDPYDALNGTRVPRWVRDRPRARQGVVQVRKRLPVEIGQLLGVRPFLMAKSAGAFLTAAARGSDSGSRVCDCEALIALAREAAGCLGGGRWGYEFDVQTRWAYYPRGSANLIATAFVARGFAEAGTACQRAEWTSEGSAGARYLRDELLSAAARPYFRYVADSETLVHNANLLGAALVVAMGVLDGDGSTVRQGVDAALTSVAAQGADGSWPYGEGPRLSWRDSFHTAYALDGLLMIWLATRRDDVAAALREGVAHWQRDFFGPAGEPYYRPDGPYPLDIHSAATAVDVAARLATWGFETADTAERVAAWAARTLVDLETGETCARKLRFMTDRRHFVRWGDAHWALASSSLGLVRDGRRDAFEEAVRAAAPGDPGARQTAVAR